jgi:hypothetical protein
VDTGSWVDSNSRLQLINALLAYNYQHLALSLPSKNLKLAYITVRVEPF